MEERQQLQFCQADTAKEEGCIYTFCVKDDDTILIGKEVVYTKNTKIVYYIAPLPNTNQKAMLLMCIDKDAALDDALQEIDNVSAPYYRDAFPLLWSAVCDGVNDNYTNAALMCLEMHGKKSYCIGRQLCNINIEDLDCEYILREAVELFSYIVNIFEEIEKNEISTWDWIKIGFLRGLTQAKPYLTAQRLIDALMGL